MADSAPRNFRSMPISTPMHHTQPSYPSRTFVPLPAAAVAGSRWAKAMPLGRGPRRLWPDRTEMVFEDACASCYSDPWPVAPADGMVLREAGLTGVQPSGAWARLPAGTRRDQWGTTWCICKPCAPGPSRRTSSQA